MANVYLGVGRVRVLVLKSLIEPDWLSLVILSNQVCHDEPERARNLW